MSTTIMNGASHDTAAELNATPIPMREGRYVRLRPVSPADYGWLYEVGVQTDAGTRWRLHGEVPHFDQFIGGLLSNATATFVIEGHDGALLGMTQIWNLEQLSRHAQITAFLAPDAQGTGWPMEGVAMCMDYAFRAYDLRKLYLETLDSELQEFRSLVGGVLREEGCLRGHRYVYGEYVDLHVLALYREDFDQLMERLSPSTPSAPTLR